MAIKDYSSWPLMNGHTFTKALWEELQRIAANEQKGRCFDWDIQNGYLMCGTRGLTVYQMHKGKWRCKHIPQWQTKTAAEANQTLKEQEWRVEVL